MQSSSPVDNDVWNDEEVVQRQLNSLWLGQHQESDQDEEGRRPSAESLFNMVHGGKMLHQGVRRTWLLLNKVFPAHKISIRKVAEMVDNCAVCQKFRLGLRDQLEPVPRVLKPEHHRQVIGVDNLTISPVSKDGYKGVVVIVNHYTHFVYLHPVKSYDAESMAGAIMAYMANFALVDGIITDPGSDMMSAVVKEVNEWLGLRHKVSLVDVHTSNGCENTNKMVLQYLAMLTSDVRMKGQWSNDIVLKLIQFHINSSLSSEAGIVPFEAMFGTDDANYYNFKPGLTRSQIETERVRRLDESLKTIRDISSEYQLRIKTKRLKRATRTNQFAVNDLVLKTVRTPTIHWKKEKLGPNFTGPWKVVSVNKNDYVCEHITHGIRQEFHVNMLKPYFGTVETAKAAALLDYDQFIVKQITNYVGDPLNRKTMEFETHYEDGDVTWKLWDEDLFACSEYVKFCRTRPELWSLIVTTAEARKQRSALNKTRIVEIELGDSRYVDLRALGQEWYNGIGDESLQPVLPDEDTTIYVVQMTAYQWRNKVNTKLRLKCDVLNIFVDWNHDMVKSWGQYEVLREDFVLVNEAFVRKFPQVVKCSSTFLPVSPVVSALPGGKG